MKIFKKNTNETYLILFLIISLSFLLIINVRNFLPDNFFYDNETIRGFMAGQYFVTDKSYQNVANVFKAMGFTAQSNYFYEQIFSWFIFSISIILGSLKFKLNLSKVENIIILFWYSFLFIAFNSQMSKDLVMIMLVVLFIFFANYKNMKFVLSTLFLLYALFFRTYWLLIILVTWILYFAYKKSRFKVYNYIELILALYLSLGISYKIFMGRFISDVKTIVNLGRLYSPDAKTMIFNPIINRNLFTDFLNNLYSLVNLIIPIDGIQSPNEIVYYLWLWTLIIYLYKHFTKINKFIFFNIISFILIQALFEPDMGSALRHQIYLPYIIFTASNFVDYGLKKKDFKHEKSISYSQH